MKRFQTTLILVLFLATIYITTSSPLLKNSCAENQVPVIVLGENPEGGLQYCLPKGQVIFDCEIYTIKGGCAQCPTGSSVQSLDLTFWVFDPPNERYACIPFEDQTLNCLHYRYSPQCTRKYECLSCPVFLFLQYRFIDIVDDPNGVKKACSLTTIPGCKQYVNYQTVQGITFYACKTCQAGLNQWTGSIKYSGIQISDKACIVQNSIRNCSILGVQVDKYVCNDPLCEFSMSFAQGSTELACLENSYKSAIVANCSTYSKYQVQPQNIKCVKCNHLLKLVENYQVSSNQFKTACIDETLVQEGCKKFIYNNQTQELLCVQCLSSQYDFIQLDQQRYKPSWLEAEKKVGMCFKKGRYNVTDSLCDKFAITLDYQSALQCWTCKNPALNVPCIGEQTQCLYGFTQISLFNSQPTTTDKKCTYIDNLIDYCLTYEQTSSKENLVQCKQCKPGYGLVSAQNIYGLILNICLAHDNVIPNCYLYDHHDLKRCIKFYQPADKCYVKVNDDPHCEQINMDDFGKCKKCEIGWILSSDELNCNVDTLINCQKVDLVDSSKCATCKLGFALENVQVKSQIYKICLPESDIIPHCSIQILVEDHYECKTCNESGGYGAIQVIIDNVIITKCYLKNEFVENCQSYSQFSDSCAYMCQSCLEGFRLVNVKYSARIRQKCFDENTEYLPFCDLYTQVDSKFYCKTGHCVAPSVAISIGPSEKQLACTTYELFSPSNGKGACSYYKRPSVNDHALQCLECVDSLVSQPFCKN